MARKGILLLNLGSPKSTSVPHVREYLREFLGDERVIDYPAVFRFALLEGIDNQHVLIRELDHVLAGLIEDLQRTKMLDKTLVVIGTEFGRPAWFDAKGGRGHQGTAFSMILAGGGLKHCGAYGQTDDLSKKVVENPVSIPDFHATILAALNVDTSRDLMAGSRPVPVTDGGVPIARLF